MANPVFLRFSSPAPSPSCIFCQSTLGLTWYKDMPELRLLCERCIEEARSLATLARTHGDDGNRRPLAAAISEVKRMKNLLSDMKQKINFLSGLSSAFKEQIHTDIQLKPGCNGPSIPAHRALLAAKSEIFKNMLDSDGCKAPSTPSDTITLAELNAEQLKSLLEFLYCGSLSNENLEKHVCALYAAAHKYEISYLQEICGRHIAASLNLQNAFDILEVADTCSDKVLKEASLSLILKNMEGLVLSEKYESFALKNPNLSMEITRDFFLKKNRK